MNLFGFLKKRKKVEPNTPPHFDPNTIIDPETERFISAVCSTLSPQFFLLRSQNDGVPPPIVRGRNRDKQAIVDLWLAGYISGYCDAFSQLCGRKFDINVLYIIYAAFYEKADAVEAIHTYHIARLTLASDKEAAHILGFDEFEEGMLAGGNNVMDWHHKEIERPLGIYKKYSNYR